MSEAGGSAAGKAPAAEPLLDAREVYKSYWVGAARIDVLTGLDLKVVHGEMVCIVGKSGVGKSTLLHLLGGLDHPDSGQIRLRGRDLVEMDEAELSRFRNATVGFVFQFHHLLSELSALDNAMMPALIARQRPRQAEERARWLLHRVGLDARASHRPAQLSGGEQQRVAIARALMMEPALVLADEPTGNLDQRTSDEIHALLTELNTQTRTAFVIATHNLSFAGMMHRVLRQQAAGLEPVPASEVRGWARSAA